MMIHIIEKYVQEACSKDHNLFGTAILEQHILVVLYYANQLAELLYADREVIFYE